MGLLGVDFVRELDLKCLRGVLDDRTLAPLEKIAQVVGELVAEPQSTPKTPPRMSRGRSRLLLTVTGNDALSMPACVLDSVRVAVSRPPHSDPCGLHPQPRRGRPASSSATAQLAPKTSAGTDPFRQVGLASDPALSDDQGEGERSWT